MEKNNVDGSKEEAKGQKEAVGDTCCAKLKEQQTNQSSPVQPLP